MFLFTVILAVGVTIATAQKTVVLESNGTTTVFGGVDPLIDAYNAAVSGDTLYVSGGSFNAPATIDKGLVIIGAGYSASASPVTNKTYVMSSGNIKLGDNCKGLYLEGMEFQRGLNKLSEVSTNITIIRCIIGGDLFFAGKTTGGAPTNSAIIQCDIYGGMSMTGFNHSIISNCIIRSVIDQSVNNIFRNNAILYGYINNPPITSAMYNTFINNIFSTDAGPTKSWTCLYNIFQKNIFRMSSPSLGDGATDIQNYKNIDLSTVYVNAPGGDYHLLEAAKTVYLGDDGTEVGIYGGMIPWKEGAIPMNPHITEKSVKVSTENPGYLDISFKVSAQQN